MRRRLARDRGARITAGMHITLVDDSIPFDGYTASSRPLGGAEKAFASLPGALARRGHRVSVFNRCRWGMTIEGAVWETFDGRKPLSTDLLVAFRKPSLLEFVRQARRRVFWHTGPGRVLAREAARARLADHQALVLLVTDAQRDGLDAPGLALARLPPALRPDYLRPAAITPATPPHAIVTTHPAQGLDWLLELWVNRIRPQVPEAELHLHSMILAKVAEGGEVDPALAPLARRVLDLAGAGVVVVRPQGDTLMAEAFRRARVHLYPGHADDVTAFTLMESQAAGLPAVVRPLGAAPERLADGHSGAVAPDDDAFANLAVMLLGNDAVRAAWGGEAAALYAGRDWDAAAEAFEALVR